MQLRTALFAASVFGLLALAPSDLAAQAKAAAVTDNPYTGKADAIAEGKKLYMKWGCYGCHGTQGGGGMGPSLIDPRWLYGETDADVFKSIHEGRPKGMPAWGDKLSRDEILKVMAYIRSSYKGAQK